MSNNSPKTYMPSASIKNLKLRAQFIQRVRSFFSDENILEVDTPILSPYGTTDINIDSFTTTYFDKKKYYLCTSPEFHMKRLLCDGIGSIYQISKAFRNEDVSKVHNPEFTMLEWYQVGIDHFELMRVIERFLKFVMGIPKCDIISYDECFQKYLQFSPLDLTVNEIRQQCLKRLELSEELEQENNKDVLLQLIFSLLIEPNLGEKYPIFVHSFPATQASLAKINEFDSRISDRFELYYKGLELANGFHELSDHVEQNNRFNNDNFKRVHQNKEVVPIDVNLIESLKFGLPKCSGVAIGIDRLLMLELKENNINKVISFSFDKC